MSRYAIVKFLDEKKTKWADFQRRYLERCAERKKPQTIRCSEIPSLKTFAAFIGDKRLADFSANDAHDYLAHLSKLHASKHTVAHKFHIIAAAFDYAVTLGEIEKNPFHGIRPPKRPHVGRCLTNAEIVRLLRSLPLKIRRPCVVSLYTGMRRGEVLAMDWAWVSDGKVTIPGNKAKSGKGRTIVLNPRALRALGVPRPSGRIFPMCEATLNTYLTTAWRYLRMGRVRFHDFRHTWATEYWAVTKDLFSLMRQGGWSSPRSAVIYQHEKPGADDGNLRLGYEGF